MTTDNKLNNDLILEPLEHQCHLCERNYIAIRQDNRRFWVNQMQPRVDAEEEAWQKYITVRLAWLEMKLELLGGHDGS